MKLEIKNLAAADLSNATAEGWVKRVESLLTSGVDPNGLYHGEEVALPSLQNDPATDATQPPDFYFEPSEQPALRRAVRDCVGGPEEQRDLAKTAILMTTLLKYGADPYALFRQPMYRYESIPVFPGDVKHPEYDDDDTDLRSSTFARLGIFAKTLEQEYEQIGLLGETQEADFCHPYEFDEAFKEALHYEPENSPRYGVCSTLHCLLEDGGFCQPIFDFLGDSLDVDRRDPQGRTLFLAACRSIIGLDAAVDGANANLYVSGALPNPYPQPDNPWQIERQQYFPSTCTGPTLLKFFISRGADLLAVDKYGRNALHNMLAPINRDYNTVPIIDASLKYLVRNCPTLINQPDKAGIFPIHYSLRRMSDYAERPPKGMFHFEKAVDELLAANADPLVRDSRGNTVLHYLAASRLGDLNHAGDEQRRLLTVFLERGVDPKVRNAAGATALELLFIEDQFPPYNAERDYDRFYATAKEIVDAFEQKGYILTETNAAGQTLLHLVAKWDAYRAVPWFDLLKAKGLDSETRDVDGVTALQSAIMNLSMRGYS